MRLHSLRIENFRKIKDVTVYLGDATFMIGENNVGKSTILAALGYLLSSEQKIGENDYFRRCDNDGCIISPYNEVTLTAEFRNLPTEANSWRGFKGRIFNYELEDESSETGLSIYYRKKYKNGEKVKVEMKSLLREIKENYIRCNTIKGFIDNGASEDEIIELLPNIEYDKKLTKANMSVLEELDDLYDIKEDEEEWFNNPGGIMQNVLARLPKFLLIPVNDRREEMGEDGKKGALVSIMSDLFQEVRDESENYKKAQEYLNKLSQEMNPNDESSKFGTMMLELNSIFTDVFPDSKIHAKTDLSNPDKALQPIFDIQMSSNIPTPISYQGTGSIRSAVFSLLRYRHEREAKKREGDRNPVIIAFEEPELYLHPNAANSIRDTIYNLATSSSQIICTTHSPYMIDLSKKPRQLLNNMSIVNENVIVTPFNISSAFRKLHEDEQSYVKMLLKMDDYVSRVFFAKLIIIVEGDTEEIVLRETIDRLPNDIKKKVRAEVQVIKARGKSTIISLCKYFNSMDINYKVIHDRDIDTEGASVFNTPIADAIGDEGKRIMLHECVEDVLGYSVPSSDKPLKAYKHISGWSEEWSDMHEPWRLIVETVLSDYF